MELLERGDEEVFLREERPPAEELFPVAPLPDVLAEEVAVAELGALEVERVEERLPSLRARRRL